MNQSSWLPPLQVDFEIMKLGENRLYVKENHESAEKQV
jgi:hypothetical protein